MRVIYEVYKDNRIFGLRTLVCQLMRSMRNCSCTLFNHENELWEYGLCNLKYATVTLLMLTTKLGIPTFSIKIGLTLARSEQVTL